MQLAEATKLNGEVITSSPASTPAARIARWRPAVPLDTAETCAAPTKSASAPSKRPSVGPSDSRPERITSSTSASSSGPIAGRDSGMRSVMRARAARMRPASARAVGSAVARALDATGQHARLERVYERFPARLDDVLGHADRAPGLDAVRRVQQHARDRRRACLLVQDADLEVDE